MERHAFTSCYGAGGEEMALSSLRRNDGTAPMPQPKDDLSRCLAALDQHRTLIAVVELSLATWLVGGIVESRKGASVACDLVSLPRSSNRACGFPASNVVHHI
jgi:hypothetical protein